MMSDQTPFSRFIDLINFDQKLHIHEAAIQKHKQQIQELETKKSEVDARFNEVRRALHDAQKLVDEKELEMKELESQESDKKHAMDNVKNQREYESVKHELELTHAKQLALEDVLVQAWNQLEGARKKVDEAQQSYQDEIQAVDDSIIKSQEELSSIEQKLSEESAQRPEKESRVPEEWLEKYSRMRSQVEDPVVPLVDGSCSSCFHEVTGQDLIQLNRNKLLQCKGCYRFLYNEALSQQAEG